MIVFMDAITLIPSLSDDALRSVLGLLGDLRDSFGEPFVAALPPALPMRVIEDGMRSLDIRTQGTARWAASKLNMRLQR